MTTAVVFSPVFYRHNPGKGHPESARRLKGILGELTKGKLQGSRNWRIVQPEKAAREDLELVHRREYVESVEKACDSGGDVLDSDGDTIVSPESFEVALYAVGGALKAARLVMKGKAENAFALVRPPGHHAGKESARGFCVFNNVAVAASHLLKRVGLKRVLVLDIDAHHGNGTQEIFYSTDRVLYMGLHEDPTDFPGTGFVTENGEERGLGYSVNIPLPFGSNDKVYLKAMNKIVRPIVLQYQPEFVLVSAGLDGHYMDPVGNLSLSVMGYEKIYQMIIGLASETCNGKLVSVLEGGYNTSFVGLIAVAAIAKMCGVSLDIEDEAVVAAEDIRRRADKVIDEARRIQSTFWDV